MPATIPPFGWPVPTDDDLLADGAGAIRALAEGVGQSLSVFGWRIAFGQNTTPADGTMNIDISSYGFTVVVGVQATRRSNAMMSSIADIAVGNITPTSFTVHTRGQAGPGAMSFSWLAIGAVVAPGARVAPALNWDKDDIVAWLAARGVDLDVEALAQLNKDELLSLVADLLDSEPQEGL